MESLSGIDHRPGLIVFDLDGTLYRGDDPYWFYARQISRSMDPSRAKDFLAHLARFLRGEAVVAAHDGWEAVVALASRPAPPDRARFQAAFAATRDWMLTPACRLEVPAGLSDVLAEARQRVRLAVVTQSPRETSLALLTRLGLLDRFDEIATDADKPEALARLVPAWAGSLPPERVLAVGDHYANDLEPAWSAGWHTIHVNPWNVAAGPVEMTVRRLEEAYPAIRRFIHGGESTGPP